MTNMRIERQAAATPGRTGKRSRYGFAASAVAAAFAMHFFPPAQAADAPDARALAEQGGANFPACSQCHGVRGEGMPGSGFPQLAGQGRDYLAKQLQDFRSGRRSDPIMEPIAKALDDPTVAALSAFYASLDGEPAPSAGAATDVRAARALAMRGDWDHDVPACTACHGLRLAGIPPHFPAIAGQNATYTAKQLRDWKTGARANDPQGLMKVVAERLSDAQIDAVAAYLTGPVVAAAPHVRATAANAAASSAGDGRAPPSPAQLPEPDHGETDFGVPARFEAGPFAPPPEEAIPDNELGAMIRKGRDIFVDTQANAGRFLGNGLQCVNCHLDAGRKANSAPLWAAYVKYPAYRDKNRKVNSFEDRLAGCFTFSMNGHPPAYDSPEMVALVSYSYWLARGAPTGADLPGRGYAEVARPSQPADRTRGMAVYAQHCAICHGADGGGTKVAGRYAFPPLWGKDSYNAGAGMFRVGTAAAFIKANMPLGQGGSLGDQQAWDVAQFVNSHERPVDPREQQDSDAPRSSEGRK